MEKNTDIDFGMMFAIGAASAASDAGMSCKEAEDLSAYVCKEASQRRGFYDEEDDSTYWSRNKHWLIPSIVGALAFYAGADGERHGSRDRSYVGNAVSRLWKRAKGFMGINEDPMFKALTRIPST